jgi:hypothetical protein
MTLLQILYGTIEFFSLKPILNWISVNILINHEIGHHKMYEFLTIKCMNLKLINFSV